MELVDTLIRRAYFQETKALFGCLEEKRKESFLFSSFPFSCEEKGKVSLHLVWLGGREEKGKVSSDLVWLGGREKRRES